MTQHTFQTEVTQLLQLMIHSLYSEREIFLRELISNASDACDKLRFTALTKGDLLRGDEELRIEVRSDAEARTLTISDNGIGLSEAEAIEHLGTIAKSGTKAFLQGLSGDQAKTANLIGQFGVGFYSAFMVADRVVVESRTATGTSDAGVRWESTGDGNFSTETIARAARGTSVTLHLKEDAKDFAENWKLRELIKKYSDYVAYPIRLPKWVSEEDLKKGVVAEPEQVNAGQPLWTRAKDQISDEQYGAFYKSACKQFDEPATRLHFTVEGTLSFTALLFIPSTKPFDLFDRDRRGLGLYVRRVFVMDDCKDLLPDWLRFVRGIVDSDDLPLNVSREILQQQDTVVKLRKQLVKRILDHLLKLASSNEEAERKAWLGIEEVFGAIIREGLVSDHENRDRLLRLSRHRSTWTVAPAGADEPARPEKTSLEDYVRRMPAGQQAIYYVTAPTLEAARSSPHLEGFARKGYEVLYCTDAVDEWVSSHVHEFDKRKLVSVAKGADDLASAEEKQAIEAKAKGFGDFLGFCKQSLGEEVDEVRLSHRLTDSPCCLVGEEHGISTQMEELMRRMGQEVPKQKRALELNPDHPLIQRLQALHAQGDQSRLGGYLAVLRDQALLAEGSKIMDPAAFARRVQELLASAAGGDGAKAQGARA
jgi:molecular chaperone HtpG